MVIFVWSCHVRRIVKLITRQPSISIQTIVSDLINCYNGSLWSLQLHVWSPVTYISYEIR